MSLSTVKFLMGTDIEIQIFQQDCFKNIFEKWKIKRDIKDALGIFCKMEQKFSRFRGDSELMKINTQKQGNMSKEFKEVYLYCQEYFLKTKGYFNPLIDLSQIGYDVNFESISHEKGELKECNANTNFESISLQEDSIFLKKNQSLDFGGIVKGYSVDKVKDFLIKRGYKNFLINAGGDIWIEGKDEEGKYITVGIDNPFQVEDLIAALDLSGVSISTSGVYKRNWKIGKKQYHHIIDPFGEVEYEEIISVSIIATNCMASDILATSCIAMGYKKAKLFLETENIPGFIVRKDAKLYQSPALKEYNITIF